MASRKSVEHGVGWFYDLLTGDEDARVCKDIPDSACNDQPRNFFAYLIANLLNKISDELVSARLTLPWIFSLLGVPASYIAFLVPIREAGVLLPQLLVAAYIRALKRRKIVWLLGAGLSAAMLFLMALIAWQTNGVLAGWLLIGVLVLYSLARGLCSVSAKDVLGKTVSKSRRGRLMGYSSALAGIATIGIGYILQNDYINQTDISVLLVFMVTAALLWGLASFTFATIVEPAGATAGGGNALTEALRSFRLLQDDKPFQYYVISRILLLSVALVVPFYVILIQQHTSSQLSLLGWLIITNGLANSLSAPIIGKFADRNSRAVMSGAALLAGVVGLITWFSSTYQSNESISTLAIVSLFFLITLAHGAVRLGRKVYLVDMATADNRAQYVAVSNTVIGVAMLFGGGIGVVADIFNVQTAILILSIISLLASFFILRLPDVSG